MKSVSRIILLCSCLFFGTIAFAAWPLNMPYGSSTISHEIYNLHMAGFYVCVVIAVIVFGVLIYSLVKFRKSKGAKAAHFHEHLGVEIIWTTVPFLILVALAIPASIVLKHIHNTDESKLTIKVTGFQWKWKYEYLDQGLSYFSNMATNQDQINNLAPKSPLFLLDVDNPMVVPIHTKVKVLVTADDVVHSWWVPELGVKQDAIPGYINENWFEITEPGTYRGQCGELCGINHAFMPIVVKAIPQAEFAQWVVDTHKKLVEMRQEKLKPMTKEQLLALGKKHYELSCAICHQNNGEGLPPSFPALKKSRIVTGPMTPNVSFVMSGVPGTAMQAFGEQMDDQTLAAVISYTRSAWGNEEINTRRQFPIEIQPMDVAKSRQTKK